VHPLDPASTLGRGAEPRVRLRLLPGGPEDKEEGRTMFRSFCSQFRGPARSLLLGLSAIALLAPAASPGPGVHVALTPAFQVVPQGQQFELDLTVTQAGSNFNGFDAYVGFDPSALSYVSVPFNQLPGSLMTSACANLFQDFHATPDSLKC